MGKTIYLNNGGRIELIDSGFIELLHEVGSTVCFEQAQKIASRCGDGYECDTKRLTKRTVASVYTATPEAMADNKAHDTLKGCLR